MQKINITFSYHKFNNGYFIIKQVFRKNQYFLKKHLSEDVTILRERGLLATKFNVTFFGGNEVLNIFHATIFTKKKKQFSKITLKNNFWRHDHF